VTSDSQAVRTEERNGPDLLTPEHLDPLIAGTVFAGKLHHFDFIHSTNSTAMQAGTAGEVEGAVFLAERQVQGRGRGGHSWHSEPYTGIYLSAIVRPQLSPSDALWLSLITGLAAHEAVARVLGIKLDLRWPNDLMLGAKKFGGILTELSAEMERVRFAVIGIGINVNQSAFPVELAESATSLRIETGREWPRVPLAAALLESLSREYLAIARGITQEQRASIIARFEERSSYARGVRVHVEEDGGYAGTTAGLDARGFLRVKAGCGIKTVLSGGVRKL